MFKIKPNVAISDSGFIFNPFSGESYSVNPVGKEIFSFIKEGKEFDEISEQMLQKYNVDKDMLERDYGDFLSMLKQYQLIEEENEEEA